MNRELRIPFCDRDDSPFEIAIAARKALEGDERTVVRQLAVKAVARVDTVAELLTELEDPARARQLVDEAREDAGLPSVARQEVLDCGSNTPPVTPGTPAPPRAAPHIFWTTPVARGGRR